MTGVGAQSELRPVLVCTDQCLGHYEGPVRTHVD